MSPGLASGDVTPFVQLGRTQVHVLVQVEAELEQQAAFQNARLDARIADGAQQDGVGLLDAVCSSSSGRIAPSRR